MNKIFDFIKKMERKNFPFKPTIEFYNTVGINKKRWGKLMRNEVSPTISEIENVAEFFKVEVTEIITN